MRRRVQAIEFDGPTMRLTVDGRLYKVNLPSISERLANAADSARRSYSVSPSGYGIHWPQVDEDLTVDGLIARAKGEGENMEETSSALKDAAARDSGKT